MAYYLPPEIIQKLKNFNFTAKATNDTYPNLAEAIYPQVYQDGEGIFNIIQKVFLKITVGSSIIEYNFLLDIYNIENLNELLVMRELINTQSSKMSNLVIRESYGDGTLSLLYENKKLSIDIRYTTSDITQRNIFIIPEEMLAVVDTLIDYIEFANKEVEKYEAWMKKMGYEDE
jgi:hypothetical protein